jgi:uncharacterized integral membrane protein
VAGDPDEGADDRQSGLADARGGAEGAPPPHEGQPREATGGRRPTRARVGQIAVLLITVLFGVFALANSQPVSFSWLFGETQVTRDATGSVTGGGVPLIVLLLVSFILGAGLGGWWTWQAGRSRQRHRDTDGEG